VHHSFQSYGNQFIPGLILDAVTTDHVSDASHATNIAPSPVRVLVPLCGKSLDMAFLASCHHAVAEVVGVDGVSQALEEFALEQPQFHIRKVDCTEPNASKFEEWKGDTITLLQGDFFHLEEQAAGGKFDAIFDRGSFVAIPPELREPYVHILGSLLQPGGLILLVTVSRSDDDATGPPYSVSESDVHCLYNGLEWVESITKLEERNLDSTRQATIFLIQAK
jgi:thiopurine S-methyltransferase